jgi:hypothetical protein
MAPGDARADLLASGRLFRVRFAGESAPDRLPDRRPTFDAAPAGAL